MRRVSLKAAAVAKRDLTVRRLRQRKFSYRQIGRRLGIHHTTAWVAMHRHEVKVRWCLRA